MRSYRKNECRRARHPAGITKSRCGAAVVEFAMITPLVFAAIFLFVEFDRYVVTAHALKEAARVGCRTAILDGTELADVQEKVAEILDPFTIGDYSMEIEPDLTTTIDAGSPVTVTLEVPYKEISWLPSPRFLADKIITATTTLPRER